MYPQLILIGLMATSLVSPAWAKDDAKPYQYCFKVHSDSEQIESATVTGYDHPWYMLGRAREIHSATFTSYTDRHCWKSDLPEMGIGVRYIVKNSGQGTNDFRCRKSPDPAESYKAKSWNIVIRSKRSDEEYPVDCRME